MKTVAENVKQYASNSIVIIISNPLDAMVTLFKKITGFPPNKVIGQAGVLDSSRFATFIAWELGVSVKDVNAMVLGGHGDTMVPIVRYANVNGIPAQELLERKYKDAAKAKEVMKNLVERTKMAGGEVVKLLKTGSAFYSPASAAIAMTESIINDEKRVLPVCAYLNGEFGINGYYVGVPAVLGSNGVEKVIEFELDSEEKALLDNSVNAVRSLVADMESKFKCKIKCKFRNFKFLELTLELELSLGIYADVFPVPFFGFKFYSTIYKSKKSIISANANILSWMKFRTSLPYKNISC
jgi:malate dehydrogenase